MEQVEQKYIASEPVYREYAKVFHSWGLMNVDLWVYIHLGIKVVVTKDVVSMWYVGRCPYGLCLVTREIAG